MKIGNLEVYGIIYKITNKINNKVYIGQTIQKGGFKERYSRGGETLIEKCYKYHLYNKLNKKYYYNEHLLSSIEKYGCKSFVVNEIFDVAFSKEELDIKEQCWITMYKSNNRKYGYNKNEGGMGNVGFTHTKETKEKISRAFKGKYIGKKHHFYGKHHTEETKRKISINHADQSGINHPMATKIICLTNGKIFDYVRQASLYYNLCETNVVKCCRGKRKHCGKLLDGTRLEWMYYEDCIKQNKLLIHNENLGQVI